MGFRSLCVLAAVVAAAVACGAAAVVAAAAAAADCAAAVMLHELPEVLDESVFGLHWYTCPYCSWDTVRYTIRYKYNV